MRACELRLVLKNVCCMDTAPPAGPYLVDGTRVVSGPVDDLREYVISLGHFLQDALVSLKALRLDLLNRPHEIHILPACTYAIRLNSLELKMRIYKGMIKSMQRFMEASSDVRLGVHESEDGLWRSAYERENRFIHVCQRLENLAEMTLPNPANADDAFLDAMLPVVNSCIADIESCARENPPRSCNSLP